MKLQPVIPFEPVLAAQLPSGSEWIAQIKWDGVRMLSYYDGSHAELINRRGNRRTPQYPELAEPRSYCRVALLSLTEKSLRSVAANLPSMRSCAATA